MARKDIASVGQIKSNTTWDYDLLVSAVGTVMLGLLGSSKNTCSQYVMVFDSASAVSNGTAPRFIPSSSAGRTTFTSKFR